MTKEEYLKKLAFYKSQKKIYRKRNSFNFDVYKTLEE